MKKIFSLLVFGIVLINSVLSQRDSIWVQTFTFDSIVTRKAVFHFPEEEAWEKIIMFHTLKCDSATPHDQYPCGEWDYTTYTKVTVPLSEDAIGGLIDSMAGTTTFELARFITPYGKRLDLGIHGFTWEYDVTDYAPLLHGDVLLEAGNGQELLDLRFLFIRGKAARKVMSVQQIWPLEGYIYKELADDSALQAQDIVLSKEAKSFKVRSVISGHGHFGPENCCEWMDKEHSLMLDGTKRFAWHVWTDCGLNPVYPQGGTWQFDRAGWCPGSFVDLYEHELTPFVKPGKLLRLDYGIQAYDAENGESGGDYWENHQLISYGPILSKYDVELLDILAPSSKDEYKRMNPVSGNARIRVKNRGSVPITDLLISYGLVGRETSQYHWTGHLIFDEVIDIELPAPSWEGLSEESQFYVQLLPGNGKKDEYLANNQMISKCSKPVYFPADFLIYLKTQELGRGADITIEVSNFKGDTLYFRNDFADSTEYYEAIHLAPGAYRFKISDKNQDGMIRHWWLRDEAPDSIGTDGRIWLLDSKREPIHKFFFDFADFLQLEFFIKPE
ncbi:MAG: hypothetical protein K9I34_04765 [Bacteroidales bacterium]|nr:hypothetical protein [Bacteroidales bacterium]